MPILQSISTAQGLVSPAPDGSEMRELVRDGAASMAIISLSPSQISEAVCHRHLAEYWFVRNGSGRLWRRLGADEQETVLLPEISINIPPKTYFQFRADTAGLEIVATTVPAWDTIDPEAEVQFVQGPWHAA